MIQAVFFDIDGTLISFNPHKIPDSTQRALRRLRERGVRVFIASGRPPVQMGFLKQLTDFAFDGYVVLNGQYCYDAGGTFYQLPIPRASLEQLLPWLRQSDLSCSFVELDYSYINRISQQVVDLYTMLGGTAKQEPVDNPARALTHTTYQLSAFLPRRGRRSSSATCPAARPPAGIPILPTSSPPRAASRWGCRKCWSGSASTGPTAWPSATAATTSICCGMRASAWPWAMPPRM